MVGRNSAIAAGVCGALFIGYCIYFDRKRRSDPNFKNRLRERRKKQKLAKERAGLSKLPDLKDAEAVQKFFLEEIQLGEELLAQGEYEKGVDHLTNAIAVCGQPQQLLQVLQQTLPPPVFQMLLTKLPTISQRETKYSGFLRFSFRGIIVAVGSCFLVGESFYPWGNQIASMCHRARPQAPRG
ncbi:mitochondrial import receptor subunit TOM20 homolog isoform X1 [Manis pentadactyla]|uniref:mitochondrial import receptor subunit TOM20 homolog isoform X1 n=1 Tax=Manis pentadactyla TaxID=143292 RepID=UPI0018740F4A|nr:mitochondrial import receptor subunit TOM20 homolog isoform X1 [Manis pentadactyla]